MILELLWPEGSGIPGPHIPQSEVRAVIDQAREQEGKEAYIDPFRRLRELQGEEGFTCIVKEGTKYQLQSLEVGSKRTPREKPSASLWRQIQEASNFKCLHCGKQAPDVKLSPDHRVPRSRGGGNEESNWQPLCEQCNNLKSSSCQGCDLNCYVCSWAFPETYKSIIIDDNNKAQIKRLADSKGQHQSDLVNEILRNHFSRL
ncbi:HNH endonuclease [Pseudohongiella sp. O18]|uniref:HNH endonuclease n=1 Tax=Pseudohongiella sp. O18 TaxID=2904248 RepID=UPI0039837811